MAAEQVHALTNARTRAAVAKSWWLFSPRVDVSVFLGSAVVSLALLLVGARAGALDGDSPDWAWVPAVLLVDVAHVYATAFRVYFDKEELRRRASLYVLAPAIALGLGVALYSESDAVFCRSLAYLAVLPLSRQQYGWVAMYLALAAERGGAGWRSLAAAFR